MSVNKHRPHIFVLPEDDANHAIANGFLLNQHIAPRSIQVLPCAGGWLKVRSQFQTEHIPPMERNPLRYMILLLDFDEMPNRRDEIAKVIPSDLSERVFIVGVWSEPEELKKAGLGSLESIGSNLALECENNTREYWDHELLRHNNIEVERIASKLMHILFE